MGCSLPQVPSCSSLNVALDVLLLTDCKCLFSPPQWIFSHESFLLPHQNIFQMTYITMFSSGWGEILPFSPHLVSSQPQWNTEYLQCPIAKPEYYVFCSDFLLQLRLSPQNTWFTCTSQFCNSFCELFPSGNFGQLQIESTRKIWCPCSWQEHWTRGSLKVPPNLNYSMILWYIQLWKDNPYIGLDAQNHWNLESYEAQHTYSTQSLSTSRCFGREFLQLPEMDLQGSQAATFQFWFFSQECTLVGGFHPESWSCCLKKTVLALLSCLALLQMFSTALTTFPWESEARCSQLCSQDLGHESWHLSLLIREGSTWLSSNLAVLSRTWVTL